MLQFQTLKFDQLGGIQTKKALANMALRDAVSCAGGYFDIDGSFVKRMGGEKYNTTSLSASGTGIYDFRYSTDTQQKLIICAGTQIYHGNGGAPSSIKTGMTSGAFYDFETINDYAVMVNGVDGALKYDGTTVTNLGISRPVSSPTLASAAGGTLAAGTYTIVVTFVNDSGPYAIESNPCNEVSITIAGNQIDLTNIPVSSDAQVTKRYIYMTSVGGSILRFNKSVNDNVTTTASITADSTGSVVEKFHDTPPTALNGIEQFQGRIFGFKNNLVYFTLPYLPWYWPQGTFDASKNFSLEIGNSDPITGLKAYLDGLLVFKKYDVYFVSGTDELNYSSVRLQSDERVGCVADRTVKVIDNYCYFLGLSSVYRTNGQTIEDVGSPIGEFFNSTYTDATYRVTLSSLSKACAENIKSRNLYVLFLPTESNTVNNMAFAMNTSRIFRDQTGEIVTDWNPWPGFTTQAVTVAVESGEEKWFRIDDTGYVFRQDEIDGDGAEITSTPTSSTNNTLTDTTQSWTVNAYAGLYAYAVSSNGDIQRRLISSNTSDTITVSSNWSTNPTTSYTYYIGGIPYHYQHSWHDYGNPTLSKRLRWVRPRFEIQGNYAVTGYTGYDFTGADVDSQSLSIGSAAFWDSGLYDVAKWDASGVFQDKFPVPGSRIHRWSTVKFENNAAGQPIKYNGCDKIFQIKGIR